MSRGRPRRALAATAVFVAALAAGACGERRCVLSGRHIRPGMAVGITLAGERRPETACCLQCAITYAKQTGTRVHIHWVTDYATHKTLAPARASYVVGSNVVVCSGPPVKVAPSRRESAVINWDRCEPSIIAFGRRDEALAFQQAHGGRIQTFAELVAGTGVVAAGKQG